MAHHGVGSRIRYEVLMQLSKNQRSHKYTLQEDVHLRIGIKPPADIVTPEVSLLRSGRLIIKKGYQWNGPKCRGFWCKNAVRGALIHHVLCQLMREQHLPDTCKSVADKTLMLQCIDDGTPSIVARLLYSLAKRENIVPVKHNTFEACDTDINRSNC